VSDPRVCQRACIAQKGEPAAYLLRIHFGENKLEFVHQILVGAKLGDVLLAIAVCILFIILFACLDNFRGLLGKNLDRFDHLGTTSMFGCLDRRKGNRVNSSEEAKDRSG